MLNKRIKKVFFELASLIFKILLSLSLIMIIKLSARNVLTKEIPKLTRKIKIFNYFLSILGVCC